MIPFKNKKIAVLGVRSGGISMVRYAIKKGATVEVYHESHQGINERDKTLLEGVPVAIHSKDSLTDSDLLDFEGIILAAIVPGYRSAIEAARKKGIPVESDMELACQVYNKPIIAVTGANGKTTVCKMLEFVFKADGKKLLLAGGGFANFGDTLLNAEPYDFVIVEASPIKLSLTQNFRPKIAIFLNVYSGQAEKFSTMEEFGDTLSKIFKQQGPEDYCIYPNRGFVKIYIVNWKCKSRRFLFDRNRTLSQGAYYLRKNKTLFYSSPDKGTIKYPIEGNSIVFPQLLKNFLPVICAAKTCGVSDGSILDLIKNFVPPPHRMEFVKKIRGNIYINDAKARSVAATYHGLTYLPNQKVILIAGGQYTVHQYYQGLIPRLKSKVKCLIIFGEHRERFKEKWGDSAETYLARNLAEAVKIAVRQISSPEDVILFSPAAQAEPYRHPSSYQRGEEFKKIVQRISEMDQVRKKVLRTL